ncbi:MAG: hypothetical protein IKI58_09505 [Oscillospiraceae bacterium]|nr:hypothetical protein [Oscillospiraceae bacterium]
MDVKRCDKGHFYDGARFQSCPHCEENSAFQAHSAYAVLDDTEDDQVTFAAVDRTAAPAACNPETDQDVTVGILQSASGNPAVGWTVMLNGPRRGTDYTLYAGVNPLSGYCETAQERSCTVVYDPKTNQYMLHCSALPAAELSIDGQPAESGITVLKGRCRIQCGDRLYLFIPLCQEGFQWPEE